MVARCPRMVVTASKLGPGRDGQQRLGPGPLQPTPAGPCPQARRPHRDSAPSPRPPRRGPSVPASCEARSGLRSSLRRSVPAPSGRPTASNAANFSLSWPPTPGARPRQMLVGSVRDGWGNQQTYAVEALEVAVERHHRCTVLECQSSQVGVVDQVSAAMGAPHHVGPHP
jgi:hypothetical protein